MSAPGPKATIEYAREWLRERLHDGATCPACTQHVQLYKRKLNSGMAKALIQIYRHAGQEWTRVQDMPNAPKGGDYAKLRFWDLLVPSVNRAQDGNSSGYWRVTEAGVLFVTEKSRVPSHLGTFNNKTYPLKDNVPLIGIREALGDKFNYDALLRGE